jgi:60 kDa SS-A/Ro ribonucleoprotein
MTLRQYFSTRQTAQNQSIPGSNQVANSAGGFAWAVNDWTRLERFLVLGSEGGTYYIQPRQLTVENAEAVLRCVQENGRLVVERVVTISESGRAPKNDPALFVLALCAGTGDEVTRRAALAALPRVARTGTHLFHFLEFVEGFRGWGRGLRRGVANWYTAMPAGRLAYQAVKYQQRDGWSHRDALRLAHPQAEDETRNTIFNWITQGWESTPAEPGADEALRLIWAFEQARLAADEQAIIALINEFNLPWESIPTEWLASANVWRTLLPRLPMTALLRNLARMTANGAIKPMSAEARLVVERITDGDALRRARVHPIGVLAALKQYEQGHGERGKLAWEPVTAVLDALDRAFYLAFHNVQPTGKRLVLALDVSGSMGWGNVANIPGLTPRVVAAAMALVTARVEPQFEIIAFSDKMVRVNISPRMRLDDLLKVTEGIPFGGTDCALPMMWALQNGVAADAFVIYTDSETWAGQHMHPAQALQAYRQKMGIAARLVVVGMVSNGFSIADPDDGGMLDVIDFDTATPQVIADFIGN